VKRVVYIIAAIAFTTAVAFFIIGMARSQPFVPTFVNGFIVVLVANIPQGLPATVRNSPSPVLLSPWRNESTSAIVSVLSIHCIIGYVAFDDYRTSPCQEERLCQASRCG
jgi:hypothetical protein